MEGYSFNSLQAAPGSALAGNSSSLLVQQQQQPTSLISQQYYYEYHHQQQPQPQPTQHQQPNSTDYLFATSQNSPSFYYTSVDSTQALNSYNTDFTTNSFTAAVSNNNNNTNNNVIYTQTAPVADFQPSTIVPESFDFGGGNFLFEESSVFLSPQTQSSAASSASQSPESKSQYFALSGNAATTLATDSLDLSLEELLQNIGSEEDNIFGGVGVEDDLALSDELFEALKDVAEGEEGEEDFFSELNFEDAGQLGLLSQGGSSNTATLEISSSSSISSNSSNSSVCSASSDFFLNASFSSSSSTSSVSSTPKRKYSSDSSSSSSSSSSTYCYSEASYQTASTSSSSEPEIEQAVAKSKPASSSSSNKRARRTPKASPVEKAARKKDQNKRAACRYRSKKRTELHSSELTMEELEAVRDGLAEQVRKLQTEFGVILPLARAAFAHDAAKRARLQAMLARVDGLL